ncbi:MAG: glycine oxidase ThiO [Pseudohongiella sp.]|nr:glycine oxidase ThiO [Pseudohongiella sp.]
MTDFLIIGAGVSGLLLARELLKAGASVCVVDKSDAGREASWAGGGIVSPLYPWRYSDSVTALANHAQNAYPTLVADLFSETGIDSQLSPTGLLMLDADDRAEALAWATFHGRSMHALDSDDICHREPLVAADFRHALWMPDVANVRNPRLLKALRASVMSSPAASLIEHCEVQLIDQAEGAVSQIRVSIDGVQKFLRADQYVVTAGAWSADLLSGLVARPPIIKPVKGEMLLYRSDRPLLKTIVLSKGRYLIPRADNLILAGSTLEHCGFDKKVSDSAKKSLTQSAIGILPALADMPVVGHWAGLRPGAAAGVPYIGRMPGFRNLSLNAGHYRNGLVLAPASARLMADILLGRPTLVDPAPYDPAHAHDRDAAF